MIYFFHVMRTGGRSLIKAMMEQFDDSDEAWKACFGHSKRYKLEGSWVEIQGKRIVPWDPRPTPPFYFSWSHMPQVCCELPEHTFTVTMLRDPIERFASMHEYMEKYRDWDPLPLTIGPYMKWLGNNLVETAMKFPPSHRLAMVHHFSRENNPVEAAENIRGLDFWFRLENIGEGFKQLGKKLGLAFPTLHVGNEYRSTLSEEDRDQLSDLFLPEFQLLELLE